jgi:hypothetical protein
MRMKLAPRKILDASGVSIRVFRLSTILQTTRYAEQVFRS